MLRNLWTKTILALVLVIVTLAVVSCGGTDDEVKAGDTPATEPSVVVPSEAAIYRGEIADLKISSPNFQEKKRPRKRIPTENTCYGENQSPPLSWSGVPEATKSLALIAEDVDMEDGVWVHWILYKIPSDVTELPAGIPTSTDVLPDNTTQGTNDYNTVGYNGPCPQQIAINYWNANASLRIKNSQKPHRYVFTLYALNTEITLAPRSSKKQLVDAMDGHILAQGDTMGKFQIAPTSDRAQEMNRDTSRGVNVRTSPTGTPASK